jgi:predicted transcriptional regulator
VETRDENSVLTRTEMQIIKSLKLSFRTYEDLEKEGVGDSKTLNSAINALLSKRLMSQMIKESDLGYSTEYFLTPKGIEMSKILSLMRIYKFPDLGMTRLKLKILEFLDKEKKLEKITKFLDIEEAEVKRNLRVLVNTNLIKKEEDIYSITYAGEKFLSIFLK